MAEFYFPKRKETPRRYDNNRDINDLIAIYFEESLMDFNENDFPENISQVTIRGVYAAWEGRFRDVPYGTKTLGEAGCAVFCLWQGLASRAIYTGMDLEDFANYISDYYEQDKGSYHNLFDHYNLRRATHFQELFDTLKMGKIVTLLVRNKDYSLSKSEEGSHFINIIGKDGSGFIIYDSQTEGIINYGVPMRETLYATRVAWLW